LNFGTLNGHPVTQYWQPMQLSCSRTFQFSVQLEGVRYCNARTVRARANGKTKP
jgi:hypothetical protein